MNLRGARELLVTIGIILLAFVLSGVPPTDISALTPGEIVIVVLVSLVLAVGGFAAAFRWLQRVANYIPALLGAALISLLVAGVVTDRVRGPACLGGEINDISFCKAPPRGVIDVDAWWQGWAAAESIMIVSGCIGTAVGSLVKLEIRKAAAS